MSIWWSLHLRREAASVPLARRLLLGAMETAGVEDEIAHDLSLALSEACANAVEHGGEPGHSDQYRVTAFLDGDMCRIEVTDHGPGFPLHQRRELPGPPPPLELECGRGMHLIEALCDHARFGNQPGDGAVVSFDKILKWRADALLHAS
ncbi:ATP-binding protein [Streptomyces sp. XM4193]|uniref:ATP-binding protein n=1 Tax=Streptomyces sp. XM4193 TaxID=2929782 RepID=UPI001FF9E5D8|nr:ATP-binding protein [Streptomyces sp. XM4193]MCK1794710.1 ATP-binding protein [Streptomyces sp. XM4193]